MANSVLNEAVRQLIFKGIRTCTLPESLKKINALLDAAKEMSKYIDPPQWEPGPRAEASLRFEQDAAALIEEMIVYQRSQ